MKNNILIFIPAYNVEDHIFKLFIDIPENIFKKDNISFLIINDASTDNTSKEIKKITKKFNYRIIIKNFNKNKGYGGVQKYAFKFAIKNKYKFLIMLHGDGQYTPKKLNKFINELKKEKHSAIFGTRMSDYNSALKGGMPVYKFIGNICLTFLQNIILSSNISEFHSGYRSFRVNDLKLVNFNNNSDYYNFDTEILIRLLQKKLKIKEIAIPTIYKDQISHLKSIPYGIKTLISTIKLNFKKD